MLEKLLGRVRRLLVSPAAEWEVIDTEPADMGALYKNYVGPLVVAAAAAELIGIVVFGTGLGIRPPLTTALSQAVVGILLGLAMVYVFALIIDALAPTFGAEKNFGQAFKVAAYAPTASWVAALLLVLPGLRMVSMVLSLYSLYLLFVGLPKLMKPAPDKGVVYTVVAILAVVLLVAVVGVVVGAAVFG